MNRYAGVPPYAETKGYVRRIRELSRRMSIRLIRASRGHPRIAANPQEQTDVSAPRLIALFPVVPDLLPARAGETKGISERRLSGSNHQSWLSGVQQAGLPPFRCVALVLWWGTVIR